MVVIFGPVLFVVNDIVYFCLSPGSFCIHPSTHSFFMLSTVISHKISKSNEMSSWKNHSQRRMELNHWKITLVLFTTTAMKGKSAAYNTQRRLYLTYTLYCFDACVIGVLKIVFWGECQKFDSINTKTIRRKSTTTYPNELALFWAIYDRIL